MGYGARKAQRVRFTAARDVVMVAIDGAWRRPCRLLDMSATGARLVVEGTVDDARLTEFFLFLSADGRVNRRCEFIRMEGDEVGVRFLGK